MDFFSQAVAAAIPSCIGPVLKNIAYPFKVSDNVKALDVTTGKLAAAQADVKNRVENAELQGLTQTNQVGQWLARVEAVKGEVDEIRKRYQERSRCFGTQSFNCWSNYSISKHAMKKVTEVQELCEEGGKLVEAATKRPLEVPELPIGSKVVVPKENADLQEILRYIDNDQYDVIGIWGMGGVGKTRLLKLVNNAYRGSSAFDVVTFVTASRECTVEKIQAELCNKCGFGRETSVESQARIISNYLSNRNFLILLDDLWGKIDLDVVGIPLGLDNQLKKKVIITTRSESVCGLMDVKKSVRVDGLDREDALRLFKEKVGDETIKSHPRIESLVEIVVKELNGLPLALITIGRSMYGKRDPREWEHAIDLLKKSRLNEIEITPDEEKIYYQLKFSYDSLESPELRNCFLACSLWPEDYLIDKIELIECWIGLELLDISDATNIYDLGYAIMRKLLSACLLEEVESESVKMHDVIRDMALWLAHDFGKKKDKWVVRTGAGVNEVLCEKDRWCHVERTSLFLTGELVNQSIQCDANKLQFLRVRKYFGFGARIVVENLRSFSNLAFLDLSRCDLTSFPPDISNLVNLRFLDLSSNSITSVPKELKHVRNLRYLFLGHNDIKSFPEGVISELKELMILDLYKCRFGEADVLFVDQSVVEYLTSLIKELVSLDYLRCLNITLEHPTHFKSLLELPNFPVRFLELHFENEIDTLVIPSSFIGNSRVQNNLYRLDLLVKNVSKIVIEGNSQSQLGHLEYLLFYRMEMLEMIEWQNLAPEVLLPSLRTLSISGCDKLKDVSWTLYLPCLRRLALGKCDNIVQLIERFDAASATKPTFPFLVGLYLWSLPKLQIICDQLVTFPSLEMITIIDCPMLKKLPFQSNTVPEKLKTIVMIPPSWEQLEWDDNDLKQILQPLVTWF